MVYVKKLLLRLFLVVEMCTFGYVYVYGKNGLELLRKHENTLVALQKNIMQLNAEIVSLEQEISVWQLDDFYKEKIAREQLQMARKGDELFYIGV